MKFEIHEDYVNEISEVVEVLDLLTTLTCNGKDDLHLSVDSMAGTLSLLHRKLHLAHTHFVIIKSP